MSVSSPTSARAEMLEIIGKSVFHALGLLESLRDETTALNSEDTEALMQAIDAKELCVGELKRLDDRRRELCLQVGFDSGPFQMDELAAWCGEDGEIMDRWNHLMEIAVECNRRNLTNGSILRLRQQHLESSLAVLRGDQPETDTYHRDGTNGMQNQRALARA